MTSWFDRWIIWRLNFIWSTLRSYLNHIALELYLKHIAFDESQLKSILEFQRFVNRFNSMISDHLLEKEKAKWHEQICEIDNFDIDIWNIINFLSDDVAETRRCWANLNINTRIERSRLEITWLRIWLSKLKMLIIENENLFIICLNLT